MELKTWPFWPCEICDVQTCTRADGCRAYCLLHSTSLPLFIHHYLSYNPSKWCSIVKEPLSPEDTRFTIFSKQDFEFQDDLAGYVRVVKTQTSIIIRLTDDKFF